MEEREIKTIRALLRDREYSEHQENRPFESDSEIIFWDQLKSRHAYTMDILEEEIRLGIYRLPYTWGWISALMSLSDLYAVGAIPRYMLMGIKWDQKLGEKALEEFSNAFHSCLAFHHVFLIGGDTNWSDSVSITTTGIGEFTEGQIPLTRQWKRVGDPVYVSGKIGRGNLCALYNFLYPFESKSIEKKVCKTFSEDLITELRKWAKSMIDTSDGVIQAALQSLLPSKFGLEIDLTQIPYEEEIYVAHEKGKVPLHCFAFAPVGEYELLFSVDQDMMEAFEEKIVQLSLPVKRIGTVIPEHFLKLLAHDKKMILHSFADLPFLESVEPQEYIQEVVRFLKEKGFDGN